MLPVVTLDADLSLAEPSLRFRGPRVHQDIGQVDAAIQQALFTLKKVLVTPLGAPGFFWGLEPLQIQQNYPVRIGLSWVGSLIPFWVISDFNTRSAVGWATGCGTRPGCWSQISTRRIKLRAHTL